MDNQYRDGLTNWEYLESLFSKNSVMRGSLEKFKKTDKKRGTQEVDDEFLKEIELWREELAKNLIRNNNLTERELNSVVQNTIDRIIFLRICEDRDIESENTLLNISNKKEVYSELLTLFQQADAKYNSGLFHFRDERGNLEPADTLSLNVKIADNVLKEIIKSLYYPAPYQFNQMPADILGSVYERFLGKIIRLTSNHRAIIEEKPEVRKAGGVYYTPSYIVDYIVENTIGEQLKGKTPKTLTKFRVVDPACGSGSFLIVAYQRLLDWYLDQYMKSPESYKKQLIKVDDKSYKLTIAERKRILTEHIFGVDIDSQAVEVTKLSLLLKTLEGITAQEATPSLAVSRILPNLSNNIKCENSLIGSDFYNGQQKIEFSIDEQLKINVFDWDKEFQEVFADGGFDTVIGNPPYVQVYDNIQKEYIEKHYLEFKRNGDLYVAFIAKGILLVKPKGVLSYITPNTYLRGDYFTELRQSLIKYRIKEILDFGTILIFDQADVFTAILNISKQKPDKEWLLKSNIDSIKGKIDNKQDIFILENTIFKKLDSLPRFEDVFQIKDVGYNYWSKGRGKVRGDSIGSKILYSGKQEITTDTPYLKGSNISKYFISNPTQYLRSNYKNFLKPKIDTFRFSAEIMETTPKIVYRQTSASLVGAIDINRYHNDKTVHIIIPNGQYADIDLKYVLGIFNSKLLNYFYINLTEESGRAFAQVKTVNIKKMPFVIPKKEQQKKLIDLVDSMLKLKQQEHDAKTSQEKTVYARQITTTDDAIDQLVYKLYNLTDEEIKIVEGK